MGAPLAPLGASVLLGCCAWYAWGKVQRVRALIDRIRDTPTTRAADVTSGFTEVTGTVRFTDAPILSPLGEEPCAVFQFEVDEQVRGGKTTMWRQILSDEQRRPFLVEDASGTVLVEPEGAVVELQDDRYGESGFLRDAPPQVEELLATRYGLSTRGLVMNRTLRYRERCLRDGDDVYVIGPVESRDGRPTFVRSAPEPFLVVDRREGAVLDRFRREEEGYMENLRLAAGLAVLFLGGSLVSVMW